MSDGQKKLRILGTPPLYRGNMDEFDASRRGKKTLKSSGEKNEGTCRGWDEGGGRRRAPRYVTPNPGPELLLGGKARIVYSARIINGIMKNKEKRVIRAKHGA